ncbi:MAG TPA: 4a-hydroxytetrahydrobiopterin dehydratase [Bacillota bacterium]|nr:4a-hydroxytetrahydrobiopterin dehydratase [Bacillota bacterium]
MVNENNRNVPNWELVDGHWIKREFSLKSFEAAIEFVNGVAKLSEEKNHHPHIAIDHKHVTLRLTTLSAKKLTSLDYDLAEEIEQLFKQYA